jgi:hypothetical protein
LQPLAQVPVPSTMIDLVLGDFENASPGTLLVARCTAAEWPHSSAME